MAWCFGSHRCITVGAGLILLSAIVCTANARQIRGTFDVSIRLSTPSASFSAAAFCGVGTGSQVVKISCNQGGYNFMAYLIQNQLVVDGEQSVGFGASTGYRVVSVADREYIEMTVGW